MNIRAAVRAKSASRRGLQGHAQLVEEKRKDIRIELNLVVERCINVAGIGAGSQQDGQAGGCLISRGTSAAETASRISKG
jgi:hypothetical protein